MGRRRRHERKRLKEGGRGDGMDAEGIGLGREKEIE